jgi:hypothetical protein
LRSCVSRKLFTLKVAPVVDYASPLWSPIVADTTLSLLHRPQRVAAQAIIRSFKTVSLEVVEMEVNIAIIKERYRKQALQCWVSLYTLPKNNPVWRERRAIKINNTQLCRN